jgi:hypothetical protein
MLLPVVALRGTHDDAGVAAVSHRVKLVEVLGRYQVAEDLVTDDEDVVLLADGHHFLDFPLGPYPSRRVVWIAEDHNFALFCPLRQVREIDIVPELVSAGLAVQSALYWPSAEVFTYAVVIVVDRRQQQDSFLRGSESFYEQVDEIKQGGRFEDVVWE